MIETSTTVETYRVEHLSFQAIGLSVYVGTVWIVGEDKMCSIYTGSYFKIMLLRYCFNILLYRSFVIL
jgi:hypothetical protein